MNVSEAWLMGFDVPMERVSGKTENKQISFTSEKSKEILEICEQLSSNNQQRVLTYSKTLLSTQQMEEELLPDAANDRNATEEEKKHADGIMFDDSEWE